MNACFSWLKKSVEDTEFLSSAASACVCFALLAGTLALAAEKFSATENDEAAESADAVPAYVVLKIENFVPEPPTVPAEIENAPEETPPQEEIPVTPEPEIEEIPPPEKIDETAIRESIEEPKPAEPEPEKIPEPPQEKIAPPTQTAAPVPAIPEISAEEKAARLAAEQTLYGALADAVSRKKFYPKSARRNGRTGTVFLRVEICGAGKITLFFVEKSDAHASLIDGALETLRRVAEDFSAPDKTKAALPAIFILPVVYDLK